MATNAINAANATIGQIRTAGLNARLGVTVMIGSNDVQPELFTLADADTLVAFAQGTRHCAALDVVGSARQRLLSERGLRVAGLQRHRTESVRFQRDLPRLPLRPRSSCDVPSATRSRRRRARPRSSGGSAHVEALERFRFGLSAKAWPSAGARRSHDRSARAYSVQCCGLSGATRSLPGQFFRPSPLIRCSFGFLTSDGAFFRSWRFFFVRRYGWFTHLDCLGARRVASFTHLDCFRSVRTPDRPWRFFAARRAAFHRRLDFFFPTTLLACSRVINMHILRGSPVGGDDGSRATPLSKPL